MNSIYVVVVSERGGGFDEKFLRGWHHLFLKIQQCPMFCSRTCDPRIHIFSSPFKREQCRVGNSLLPLSLPLHFHSPPPCPPPFPPQPRPPPPPLLLFWNQHLLLLLLQIITVRRLHLAQAAAAALVHFVSVRSAARWHGPVASSFVQRRPQLHRWWQEQAKTSTSHNFGAAFVSIAQGVTWPSRLFQTMTRHQRTVQTWQRLLLLLPRPRRLEKDHAHHEEEWVHSRTRCETHNHTIQRT